ncbi:thymidylate synthase [Bailinhaonella thermotolerans]|uniref:thymidylate synthase n=1 Tax=Bailinhaonella thermotolerans TaxID=1070861 RepID=A0A3A4ALJ9_9ACTN|nr:thymidylate synthase [Bailinhaonella thermotolerans]RJL22031.1 thymidylate synthase [Bailinhaonella thermotolerans]
MKTLSANSANELFAQAVHAVRSGGRKASPRGLDTFELIGVNLVLAEPRRRLIWLPPTRMLNPAFAAAETVWILSGSDGDWIYTYNARLTEFADKGVLRGAYGPRLRRWDGHVDQLDYVRRVLKDDPDSRRAVIQLYDPGRDHHGNKDVPCTLGFRFYIRQGRLEMYTTMRSQDLWLGFCYDIFTFTVLHELMAGWLGVELGRYHHHIDSLHLYAEHLELAGDLPDSVEESGLMPALGTEWSGFDELLRQVRDGENCAHAGWREIAEVMRSYRVWKGDDRDQAWDLARGASGPLSRALEQWYDRLESAAPATGRSR